MPVLNNEDFHSYVLSLRQLPGYKNNYAAQNFNKVQWKALFQGLEDWFESERLNAKAAMEAEASITISNTIAKKIARVWMERKFKGE